MDRKILAVIPARGGSKGLPGKNVKMLCDKPLIGWTIDAARGVLEDEDICVSTDYPSIVNVVRNYGLEVPFLRPDYLGSDTSGTREVLIHALDFYKKEKGKEYDTVLVLQPTSPLRNATHVQEALALYTPDVDMVVSVKRSHAATVMVHENETGFLDFTLNTRAARRQEMPDYYEYNGAIYVINVHSLYASDSLNFEKKRKYLMDEVCSVDIDNQFDFDLVNLIMKKNEIL